jgi:predicted cupin superfamily sugar epimerase
MRVVEGNTASQIADLYGLKPLPAEGGMFRRTWAGELDDTGRPTGSAILVLLADGDISAMHRLPHDEVWHHYRGDPLDILLLDPDGGARTETLGPDAAAGQHVQLTVPAGTWMGAQPTPGGHWSLCGTTMAPGFIPADFEPADAEQLAAQYPAVADRIRALCHEGTTVRMAGDGADPIAAESATR